MPQMPVSVYAPVSPKGVYTALSARAPLAAQMLAMPRPELPVVVHGAPQQGFPALASAPVVAGHMVQSMKIEKDTTVEVLEAFQSNSKEEKVTLEPGQRGTVVRLDEDGDALIKFDDHAHKEWVVRQNFNKLRAVAERPEEPQEVRDVEKRRTRGVALQPAQAVDPKFSSAMNLKAQAQAQAQAQARIVALQAQVATLDLQHGMLQEKCDEISLMQQKVLRDRARVLGELCSLQRDIANPWMAGQPGFRAYGIDTLSQTSTSAGPASVMDEDESMKEGAAILVLEDFMSNSKADNVLLKVGQKGVVSKLDSDGDVLIKFEDHPHKEWVTKKNFHKLRVSKAKKAANSDKAEEPTVTEVSNSTDVCKC